MRLPDFFLNNRWLVLISMVLLVAAGFIVMFHLPIEAFPDLTNNQVVVTVQAPGMSPVEVEQLVTFPLETTMLGMPNLQLVRSTSKLELSMLTVIFDDSVDLYRARQLVAERLNEAQGRLPAGLQPVMGPMSTAFGEVFQYTVQAPHMSLMDIKTLHDWTIRYSLLTIPEVSEINSWGGETKQYSVLVDPAGLRRYNLSLHDVVLAVESNNANFGGSYIEHADQTYTVRGLGRAVDLGDLGQIVVATRDGTPVLLNQLAQLQLLPLIRHGAVLHDGKGETVSGMVIVLRGANGNKIIQQVKDKIRTMKLPGGAKIVPFYDQSDVIDATIHTVKKNLFEAALLVIIILLLFLGDWRAALIVAATIPLSLLFAFLGMGAFGISANLMSLGAIDFGTIVDGSVVMVENCMHRLEHGDEEDQDGEDPNDEEPTGDQRAEKRSRRPDLLAVVKGAAREVARPVTFGVLIILAVYLPVLTLEGLAGRMFRPMAVTVMSALTGSLVIALFVVPSVCSVALRARQPERDARDGHVQPKQGWFDRLRDRYARSLDRAKAHRRIVVVIAVLLVVVALGSLPFIGTEFMPTLDEGSLVITSKKLPGISLTESISVQNQIERTIRSFPEVTSVVSKMGRPDLATEAMGVYETDAYLSFLPLKQWKCCKNKQQLSDKLEAALDQIPGVTYEFTQPMQMRMDETITGTRGDAALKIFGPDLGTLERLGNRALAILSSIKGASQPQMERIAGAANLEIKVNRQAAARYGLNVADIREVVESLIGSKQISEMVIGEQRFPIAVRLPPAIRNSLDDIYALELKTPSGELVRLDQVTDIRRVSGPILINRENAHRRIVVSTNVEGRDLGSFVKEAQKTVTQKLVLPAGYSLEWGGQYQNEQAAEKRLALVLPLSLLIISGLLYATFQNLRQTLLILLIVPLALVGGIAALWLRGINLNLSASIGFIALFGVAVLNGVVMVSHINNLRERGLEIADAVRRGASDRLRPVLITATVASLGFIPMALATSRGAEVQRPLATVVIGGLITATLLTLYVLPVLYPVFTRERESTKKPTEEHRELEKSTA
jgi:cobalt-zinc-cadmium resistance protein CzcA